MKSIPLVAIGASMGGTAVLESLLAHLPPDMPPIVIVQHTLPHFVAPLVRRLGAAGRIGVVEAADGVSLSRGVAYVAPGGTHLMVERRGDDLRCLLALAPPVRFHRPSVDMLFHSLVGLPGVDVVAVLLAGMGRDGVEGMLALRRAGAETIAQGQPASDTVRMAKDAVERGAVRHIASADDLPVRILSCLGRSPRAAVASPA